MILIRADHLLNLTLTKSTLDLFQRIQSMFSQAYQKGYSSTDDQEQAMLTIYNQTGYQIQLQQISGIKVSERFHLSFHLLLFSYLMKMEKKEKVMNYKMMKIFN